MEYLQHFLDDNSSSVDLPAAIILEPIQGEGGINVASFKWLKGVEEVCRQNNIPLIVDDIQVGCGRTGTFFSFEPAGIKPDIVCLSKSISGYGLPMALTLIKPELDIWSPGEHNGTFRGNNLAFITAAEALSYWEDNQLSSQIKEKGETVSSFLHEMVEEHPEIAGEVRGRGLMQGIACGVPGLAELICSVAFEKGLIMETSGSNSEVCKVMPPLIIDNSGLKQGLNIFKDSIKDPQIKNHIKKNPRLKSKKKAPSFRALAKLK